MDVIDFFSSDSEDNNHSNHSDGRETISTDTDQKVGTECKTKTIRKHYEPLYQNGKTFRYEDNPSEYKRMRKKIQNRESATRVRGRKKNAFENLEQQVEYLRKTNSQLQLNNAKLETQNKTLKEQVDFMRGLLKNTQPKDPIDQYLSREVLSNNIQNAPMRQEEYESPFTDNMSDWFRSSQNESNGITWMGLAIFTAVLAIFVLPQETASNSTIIAYQINSETIVSNASVDLWATFLNLLLYGKIAIKYAVILLYLWILFKFVRSYVNRKKFKKI